MRISHSIHKFNKTFWDNVTCKDWNNGVLSLCQVMDKGALATRKKLSRAQVEKEILASLDHPFLPTLYAHFDTSQFSCLVMEYCSGGDLHSLRQKQPGKAFPDMAAK